MTKDQKPADQMEAFGKDVIAKLMWLWTPILIFSISPFPRFLRAGLELGKGLRIRVFKTSLLCASS